MASMLFRGLGRARATARPMTTSVCSLTCALSLRRVLQLQLCPDFASVCHQLRAFHQSAAMRKPAVFVDDTTKVICQGPFGLAMRCCVRSSGNGLLPLVPADLRRLHR
jgi:hypothetical protein